MKNFLTFSCFFLAVTAMANTGAESVQLLGVSVDQGGITFQVKSNGCTEKNHFTFEREEILEPIGEMLPAYEHHYYFTLIRKTPDRCKAFRPYGEKVFFSFDELGIAFGKFHVKNAIGGDKVTITP